MAAWANTGFTPEEKERIALLDRHGLVGKTFFGANVRAATCMDIGSSGDAVTIKLFMGKGSWTTNSISVTISPEMDAANIAGENYSEETGGCRALLAIWEIEVSDLEKGKGAWVEGKSKTRITVHGHGERYLRETTMRLIGDARELLTDKDVVKWLEKIYSTRKRSMEKVKA